MSLGGKLWPKRGTLASYYPAKYRQAERVVLCKVLQDGNRPQKRKEKEDQKGREKCPSKKQGQIEKKSSSQNNNIIEGPGLGSEKLHIVRKQNVQEKKRLPSEKWEKSFLMESEGGDGIVVRKNSLASGVGPRGGAERLREPPLKNTPGGQESPYLTQGKYAAPSPRQGRIGPGGKHWPCQA